MHFILGISIQNAKKPTIIILYIGSMFYIIQSGSWRPMILGWDKNNGSQKRLGDKCGMFVCFWLRHITARHNWMTSHFETIVFPLGLCSSAPELISLTSIHEVHSVRWGMCYTDRFFMVFVSSSRQNPSIIICHSPYIIILPSSSTPNNPCKWESTINLWTNQHFWRCQSTSLKANVLKDITWRMSLFRN